MPRDTTVAWRGEACDAASMARSMSRLPLAECACYARAYAVARAIRRHDRFAGGAARHR